MRIRSIKPEFWRSDDIDALDWDTRLVFIGLWSYVDDNGVGIYKMPNIVSDLFANDFYSDPNATLNRVSEALKQLESRSMIDLYRVGDRDYLYITNWERHQRVNNPNKPRYPLPTSENSEPTESLSRPDVEPRETVSLGTEDQRTRGPEEQRTTSSSAEQPRADVEALCERLREHIERNTDKPPTVTQQWRTAARLLLDRDSIEFDEAMRVLDWSQHDSFWQSNILSMPKFRKQFAQLQIKSRQQHRQQQQQQKPQRTWVDVARGMSQQNNYVDATVIEQGELE